jgi:hypothetical protein
MSRAREGVKPAGTGERAIRRVPPALADIREIG